MHGIHAGAMHSSVGCAAVELLGGEAAISGDAKDIGARETSGPGRWALGLDLRDLGERVLIVDVDANLELRWRALFERLAFE